jgi:hypothetical protein
MSQLTEHGRQPTRRRELKVNLLDQHAGSSSASDSGTASAFVAAGSVSANAPATFYPRLPATVLVLGLRPWSWSLTSPVGAPQGVA